MIWLLALNNKCKSYISFVNGEKMNLSPIKFCLHQFISSEIKIMSDNIQIETSWKDQLKNEFNQDYFAHIKQFIINEKANTKQ